MTASKWAVKSSAVWTDETANVGGIAVLERKENDMQVIDVLRAVFDLGAEAEKKEESGRRIAAAMQRDIRSLEERLHISQKECAELREQLREKGKGRKGKTT